MTLNRRQFMLCATLVLVAVGFIVYANSFQSGWVFDNRAILEDPRFHSLENLKQRFLHPLNREDRTRVVAFLSFTLNYIFHGEHLFGYHCVNIFIHIINALCVWWLWRLLMASPYYKNTNQDDRKILGAGLVGALFFLVHPIQTQAVTYLYQRIASLATLFYLLTVCLYFKARTSQNLSTIRRPLFFAGAAIACILAMLTKEMTFTLPFAIFMIEWFFFLKKSVITSKKFWISCIGAFVFVLIVPALFSFHVRGVFSDTVRLSNEHLLVTPSTYFLTQWRVLLKYFQIVLIPVGQSLDHDVYLSQGLWDLQTLAAGFIVFCVFLLGVMTFKKNRMVSFGIFWIFLTAAVECSFVPIRHVIFEHRMYLPMVGVSLALNAWLNSRGFHKKEIFISVLLLVVLSGLTIKRNFVWENGVTLWRDVIQKSPMQSRGYDNLGSAYLKEGEYDLALKNFFIAQSFDPTNKEMYNNIGLVYLHWKAWPLALKNFNRAIEIDPEYETAYNNRGLVKERQGDKEGAFQDFIQAVHWGPNLVEPRLNVARLAEKNGNPALALEMCEANQKIAPNNLENLRQLARLAALQGRQELKDEAFARIFVMAKTPEEILITALYCVQSGLVHEGLAVFKKGFVSFPEDARLYMEAGKVLGNYGEFGQAIEVWRAGMKKAPQQSRAFLNLIDQAQRLKKDF